MDYESICGIQFMLEVAIYYTYLNCESEYALNRFKDLYKEYCELENIKPDDYFLSLQFRRIEE